MKVPKGAISELRRCSIECGRKGGILPLPKVRKSWIEFYLIRKEEESQFVSSSLQFNSLQFFRNFSTLFTHKFNSIQSYPDNPWNHLHSLSQYLSFSIIQSSSVHNVNNRYRYMVPMLSRHTPQGRMTSFSTHYGHGHSNGPNQKIIKLLFPRSNPTTNNGGLQIIPPYVRVLLLLNLLLLSSSYRKVLQRIPMDC